MNVQPRTQVGKTSVRFYHIIHTNSIEKKKKKETTNGQGERAGGRVSSRVGGPSRREARRLHPRSD